jgi:hypothetical protein
MHYELLAADKVTGMGYTHRLWLRANRMQSYTILVHLENGIEVATATIEPSITELNESIRYYHGGSKYVLSPEEAAPLIAAGFSNWLTEVAE